MGIEAWELMGQAIGDYWRGNGSAVMTVVSDFAGVEEYPAQLFFRDGSGIPELEQYALSLCRGRVLDVGAGAGCHSLILQQKKLPVTALDISPAAVAVMRARGLANAVCGDIHNFRAEPFDTILMLMNGVGIVGDLSGFGDFLQKMRQLLKPDGQLLLDSADLRMVAETPQERQFLANQKDEDYGMITYQIEYQGLKSEPFRWLYLDQRVLRRTAAGCGWQCQIIYQEGSQYLARLTRRS